MLQFAAKISIALAVIGPVIQSKDIQQIHQ
jgi:hypothetical protein